jgi:glutamate synthase (NADPH/NADH) large chain
VADSRFCIRLSGASVVAGARLTAPIDDSAGPQASRAHLKGFAFEYMTSGVAVVLGDPGPWLCAGMTGGAVYARLWPEFGFDRDAVARRLAKGANVVVRPVGRRDVDTLVPLLEEYRRELEAVGQTAEAAAIAGIIEGAAGTFVAIRPANQQVDQAISTE